MARQERVRIFRSYPGYVSRASSASVAPVSHLALKCIGKNVKLQSCRGRRVKRSWRQSARTTGEQGRPQEAFVFSRSRGEPLLSIACVFCLSPNCVSYCLVSLSQYLVTAYPCIQNNRALSLLKPNAGSRRSVISSSSELLNHPSHLTNQAPASQPIHTLPPYTHNHYAELRIHRSCPRPTPGHGRPRLAQTSLLMSKILQLIHLFFVLTASRPHDQCERYLDVYTFTPSTRTGRTFLVSDAPCVRINSGDLLAVFDDDDVLTIPHDTLELPQKAYDEFSELSSRKGKRFDAVWASWKGKFR